MLKQSINRLTKISILIISVLSCNHLFALESDKQADFELEGDNFKNLPEVKAGLTQIKYWGNVAIQQGTLRIYADDAVIFNNKQGIMKIILTGNPAKMEQIIDAEYGKVNIQANTINFLKKQDILKMTGNVMVKSRIQGTMTGEKIIMNLKTKEITGSKSDDKRVKLIIKSQESQ